MLPDVSALAQAPDLHTLFLNGCKSISDISWLAECETLRKLDITGCCYYSPLSLSGVGIVRGRWNTAQPGTRYHPFLLCVAGHTVSGNLNEIKAIFIKLIIIIKY